MDKREVAEKVLRIGSELIDGNLNEVALTCPQCGVSPLRFSFAANRPPRYGLYIFCENCSLWFHFNLDSKPFNFRDDLVLPKYQKLEDEAQTIANTPEENDQADL